MPKEGKQVIKTNSAKLPKVLKKKIKEPELKPGQFKCTLEQAPLVTVQLLAQIVNQNTELLSYFKRAEEADG